MEKTINELIDGIELTIQSQIKNRDVLSNRIPDLGINDLIIVCLAELQAEISFCDSTIKFIDEYFLKYGNDFIIGCLNSFKIPVIYYLEKQELFLSELRIDYNDTNLANTVREKSYRLFLYIELYLRNIVEVLKMHLEQNSTQKQ